MKSSINRIAITIVLVASVSCQVQEFAEVETTLMTFYASMEAGTRTQLDYNGSWGNQVFWSPSDEISIFCKNGKGRFVSTNTEPVLAVYDRVEFVGSLDSAPERGTDPYWAVYPYSEDNTFDGEAVGVTLPPTQDAVLRNVDEGLMISVARTQDEYSTKFLYFFNLCGIISIPVYEDGIKKIVFKGNDNEPLAGRVSVSFDEAGHPFISKYDNPSHEITLVAPDMGTFSKGDMYNIVCFPGRFDKGYTIEFYRDDLVSIKQIASPVTLSRAGFVDLTRLYSGGTIYSVESEGKFYSLDYKYDSQIDSTAYWVTVNGKVFEIPEKFHATPYDYPTRIGPAVAIDTMHETVYFAKSYYEPNSYEYIKGVIYRITPSGWERSEQPIAFYPLFKENENGLELHSFAEEAYQENKYYDYYLEKMSFNHWVDHWMNPNDNNYYLDFDSSGFGKKKLSDIIYLFREKDIPDYPKKMTAVDLGLSVRWASCNLGATSPEMYGDLYAWGETVTKDSFSVENYRFGGQNGSGDSWWMLTGMSKYNDEDQKYYLDSVDDAAHVQLGDDWRIPSPEEWWELIENCSWEWFFLNGAAGMKATSKKNGNCIFLPVDCKESRYEYLFPYQGNQYIETGSYHASHVYSDYYFGAVYSFFASLYESYVSDSLGQREQGYAIRPVYGHIPIEEFSLDKSFVQIGAGESVQLNVSVLPTNASNWEVSWSSDNESIATVSQNGLVSGISAGTAVISVTSARGERTESCRIVVDHAEAPEIIDLGLSVKWASYNVGASSPEDVGLYFAWGEVEPKDEYGNDSYKWCADGSNSSITKYCFDPSTGLNGFTDGKTTLDPADDAAYVYYGGKWRMPTDKEIAELCEKTTCSPARLNGVDGYWLTSNVNGNRIFFPFTGYKEYENLSESEYGFYWSSSLSVDSSWSATYLSLYSYVTWNTVFREFGLPVRAVYGDPVYSGDNEDIYPGGEINM